MTWWFKFRFSGQESLLPQMWHLLTWTQKFLTPVAISKEIHITNGTIIAFCFTEIRRWSKQLSLIVQAHWNTIPNRSVQKKRKNEGEASSFLRRWQHRWKHSPPAAAREVSLPRPPSPCAPTLLSLESNSVLLCNLTTFTSSLSKISSMFSTHQAITMARTHRHTFLPYPPFSTPPITKPFIKMTMSIRKTEVSSGKWKAYLNRSLLFLQRQRVLGRSSRVRLFTTPWTGAR